MKVQISFVNHFGNIALRLSMYVGYSNSKINMKKI
jgi:hypothetical protein